MSANMTIDEQVRFYNDLTARATELRRGL